MTAASKKLSERRHLHVREMDETPRAHGVLSHRTPTSADARPDNFAIREGVWKRLTGLLYRSFLEPLVRSKNTPRRDALGVSLGLVVGFAIPVGGQLLTLTVLRFVLRFNYLVAAGFSLVSNPFDMIPMYYGYYYLGSYILGKPATIDFSVFETCMRGVMDKTYFWEAFGAFMALSGGILERWLVSAVLLSVVFGTLGYVITLRIQAGRCRRAAQRLGMAYEVFLENLARESRRENEAGSSEKITPTGAEEEPRKRI